MKLASGIENRCRTLIFHVRNIRTIRRFYTQSAYEQLVHALISSRFDYAHAILAGLLQTQLKQLQNIAARIVTQTPNFALHDKSKRFLNIPEQSKHQD